MLYCHRRSILEVFRLKKKGNTQFLVPKLTSKIREKCICCVLAILMLLTSNVGFIPDVYVANAASASNSLQASSSSRNSGNEPLSGLTDQLRAETSTQNESITGNVYAGQNEYSSDSLKVVPFDSQKALTQRHSDNPDYIDKVINLSEIPNTFQSTGKYVYQSDNIHMQQVIHMPKMIRKADASNSSISSTVYGQNLTLNQNNNYSSVYGNSNSSGIAGSVSESSYTLSAAPASALNTSAITDLKDGIEEDDLYLIDSGLAMNQNQSDFSVASLVYNSTIQEKSTSQPDLNHASVASSVYSSGSNVNTSFPIQNKSGHFTVGFSRHAGSNLLRFSYKNASLTLNPLNPASVSGSVYKNTIAYENIYPNTNIRYTLERNRLKEDIIVKKYTGINEFNFQLSVSNAVYDKKSSGEIRFLDPGSSQPLFYMAKPFAVDKNGNRCDLVSLVIDEGGSIKLIVDPDWLKNAVYPIVIDPTIYLPDGTFTRSSTAYKQDGTQVSANQPRYETGKFGQAIMVEEGTTNLLNANQSSLEDSLPTSFGGDGGIVTWSTATSKSGSACMRIDANTSDVWGGADLWNNGAGFTVTPGATYTFSIFAKGVSGGENILIQPYKSDWSGTIAGSTSVVLTSGTWTRITNTFTVPSGCNSVFFLVRKKNVSTPLSWYVDCLQLEQKAYATSWNIGGTTRTSETLTIPTAGVFTKGNWAVEMVYIPSIINNVNPAELVRYDIDSNNRMMLRLDNGRLSLYITSSGITYQISSGSLMVAGQSYSIIASGDGSKIRLCVNGAQIGSDTAYVEPIGALPTNLGIGYYPSGGNEQANGLIDDLRISNRARTLAEHQSAYNSGQPLFIDETTICKMGFDANLEANVPAITYIYDSLNRLNNIVTPNKTMHYQYDNNGNLIKRVIN